MTDDAKHLIGFLLAIAGVLFSLPLALFFYAAARGAI